VVGRKVLFVWRVTKVAGRERMEEAEEEMLSLSLPGMFWGSFSVWWWLWLWVLLEE
jgi:hypothetical protein